MERGIPEPREGYIPEGRWGPRPCILSFRPWLVSQPPGGASGTEELTRRGWGAALISSLDGAAEVWGGFCGLLALNIWKLS